MDFTDEQKQIIFRGLEEIYYKEGREALSDEERSVIDDIVRKLKINNESPPNYSLN